MTPATSSLSSNLPVNQDLNHSAGHAKISAHAVWVALPPSLLNKAGRNQSLHHDMLFDGPDFAGMRARCEASQPRLRDLQRSLGVASIRDASQHEQVLAAYGFDELAKLLFELARGAGSLMRAAAHSLARQQIGPIMCAAATIPLLTPSRFGDRYNKDFQVWLNPAARQATDMKGAFIVLLEHHYDPEVRRSVSQVMREFRRERGDRFFLEGNRDDVCAEREDRHDLEMDDCRLLESGSAEVTRLQHLQEAAHGALKSCVDLVLRHVSASRADQPGGNPWAHEKFLTQYAGQLPQALQAEYQRLRGKVYRADEKLQALGDELKPVRDAHMTELAVKERSLGGWNFVSVGSDHLEGLIKGFANHTAIFMVPRCLLKGADLKLRSVLASLRDEL
jgi:hypothetical protein